MQNLLKELIGTLQNDERLIIEGRLVKNKTGSRYFCESLFWASQPKQAAKT
jgi:hypothetical protein